MLFDAGRQPEARPHGRRSARARDRLSGGLPDDVPATAGSADAPFFGSLGSGAFGDLDGDGLPEYVAPTGGLRKLLIDVARLPDAAQEASAIIR